MILSRYEKKIREVNLDNFKLDDILYKLLYIDTTNLEIKHIKAKKNVEELKKDNEWLERERRESFKREDTYIEFIHEIVGKVEEELGEKIKSLKEE